MMRDLFRVRPAAAIWPVLASLAAWAPPASADALSEAAGRYRIDKTSSIRFSVDQAGGGGIRGSFGAYSGAFRIDGQDIAKSSVTITLYPKSVHANEARMENFLRSDAVFDVANHPEITFRSTAVKRIGEDAARIDGVLTARGKARKAQFDATLRRLSGGSISFHVTGSIYRSPYGMDVGTPIYSNVVQFDMVLNGTRR
ncbi:polyisoprenoid-binding protein [Mesorhizobium ephedrae]|jgi:polyisoprenoid-binding protein YceI|uniref:Polyisoprenoid-binding protein n=2 Tax=Kumtagia ephedrae TaxID=2116701 RepID=A0A2P7SQR7_9HYPH|nr:polyisoprenoid-binding protein [Mesorhizobium ephedrae]